MPYGKPAQAATRSNETWVWKMPSCPEIQVAIDGISRVLVQEQKMTAANSSGRPPGALEGARGGHQRQLVEVALGVDPRLDAGLLR